MFNWYQKPTHDKRPLGGAPAPKMVGDSAALFIRLSRCPYYFSKSISRCRERAVLRDPGAYVCPIGYCRHTCVNWFLSDGTGRVNFPELSRPTAISFFEESKDSNNGFSIAVANRGVAMALLGRYYAAKTFNTSVGSPVANVLAAGPAPTQLPRDRE